MAAMVNERRSEGRQDVKDSGHAEVRLVGVPIYELKLKDRSSKGACILIKEESSLLKQLNVGQIMMVKFFADDRSKPADLLKADVRHITKVKEGRFKGHYSAGLLILKKYSHE